MATNKTDLRGILKYGAIILLALIGLIILYQIFWVKHNKPENIAMIKYITKEIIKEVPYEVPVITEKDIFVPPITITRWLPQEPIQIDSAKIITDYLVLHKKDGTEQTYKTNFLVLYPDAPKLLDFKVSYEYLDITTFDKNSKVTTQSYPLYLDTQNYIFTDSKLTTQERAKPVKHSKMKWNELYVNTGYDVRTSLPTTGLEYNLSLGRFKFDVNSKVIITTDPILDLNAKIGYRLFK